MNFQESREQANRLRRIPLEAVLRAIGAEADHCDKAKWQTAQGVLSVSGAKFINWNQGRGGGGAIDLVMHLCALDFRSAVQWLAQRFEGQGPPRLAPLQPKPELVLPPADATQLSFIKRYLIEKRHLPDAILEPLFQSGRLYADARANAVFLLLGNEQRRVGAELRGTTERSWRGLASGSRKDLGYFALGPEHGEKVILCESAIDAISCAVLHAGCLCISTSGARPNPAWLATLLAQGYRIACGFDADPTGDHMAETMIALHPAIQRLRPSLHDWNDVLTASA